MLDMTALLANAATPGAPVASYEVGSAVIGEGLALMGVVGFGLGFSLGNSVSSPEYIY